MFAGLYCVTEVINNSLFSIPNSIAFKDNKFLFYYRNHISYFYLYVYLIVLQLILLYFSILYLGAEIFVNAKLFL